ncbi:MAG: homoserine kinase [Nocardioides sp.]
MTVPSAGSSAGFVGGPVSVTVPATSANLGPGFDSIGLALEWRDDLRAGVTRNGLTVRVTGGHARGVPTDESHLVVHAMRRGFDAMSVSQPGLDVECVNNIPHARGLGSSAAAIVGGLCLARALVAEPARRLTDVAVLQLAAGLEGHPDNVAAAIHGGLVISGRLSPEESVDDRFFAFQAPVHPDVGAVVFVPEQGVETTVARGLLPERVSHRRASANAARAALLVAALREGDPAMLHTGTGDFLHQEFRETAMPDSLDLVRRLRARGFAAAVSGAGPSVLVVGDAEQAGRLLSSPVTGWDVHRLTVARDGVHTVGETV